MRKLAIRSVKDEKNEDAAREFAQHKNVETMRKYYLGFNLSRENVTGLNYASTTEIKDIP